jgi:hypothetical protein
MSQMFEGLGRNAEALTRRRFVKTLIGVCAGTVAWAAGVRGAFASCPTIGVNSWGNCPNSCGGGLQHVACCCLANPAQCPGGICCNWCNAWAWYCVCNGQDYECVECNASGCVCSTANYLGHRPAAA